jgi:hypothetical protein
MTTVRDGRAFLGAKIDRVEESGRRRAMAASGPEPVEGTCRLQQHDKDSHATTGAQCSIGVTACPDRRHVHLGDRIYNRRCSIAVD